MASHRRWSVTISPHLPKQLGTAPGKAPEASLLGATQAGRPTAQHPWRGGGGRKEKMPVCGNALGRRGPAPSPAHPRVRIST